MNKGLTRRELLAGGMLALGATALPGIGLARTEADAFLKGENLYRDVVAYANLGEHRTATEADVKTSRWLADELRRAGLKVQLHPFKLRQFFPAKIELKVGGRDVKPFPLWWPTPTGAEPIVAPLAAAGPNPPAGLLKGKIALVKIPQPPGASIVPNSIVHRTLAPIWASGALAVVGVTEVATGEIFALNAMAGPDPWPLPLLAVGQSDEAMLYKAAAQGASTSLLLDGSYDDKAEAFEVVGKLERGKNLVIVSTPSSGWFRCAGERGPGVALWLALARGAAARKSDTSFIFVASSAHELNGLGIKHFIEQVAPKPEAVKCWLHLGAGIATYEYKTEGGKLEKLSTASPMRRLYSAPQFAPALTEAFAALPDLKPIVTDKPGGEMVLMARQGYPFFGFAGGSTFHHMPGDLPERSTGPELLEPVARSLVKALAAIEAGIENENRR